jgi:hypothetical protein
VSGIGAAGIAAALFFGHPGLGELYFLRSASPYLTIVAVCGLATALPRRTGRWISPAMLGAACLGAATVTLVHALDGSPVFVSATSGGVVQARTLPYLMLAGGLVVVCGVFVVAGRRSPVVRGLTPALMMAVAMGAGTPPLYHMIVKPFESAVRDGWRAEAGGAVHVPRGGVAAARWLRDHSSPNDVVATNAHCRFPRAKRCDNRHFWVAAYTERRVLVEGWGYANGVNTRAGLYGGPSMGYVPFGDPALLARNDAAFRRPSARTVGILRDRHGVRWLFVDERYGRPPATLSRFAALRHRAGPCAVYEIRPGSSYTAHPPAR